MKIDIMHDHEMPPQNGIEESRLDSASFSEDMQDIISRRAGFIDRWGLTLVLLILLVLFFCVWMVKCPDTIQASASLVADNAPKEILGRQDGKIVKLFAKNDDIVTQNQTLAWIESTADQSEVALFSKILDNSLSKLSATKFLDLPELAVLKLRHLGELQKSYRDFIFAWQQYNDYLVNGYYFKRVNVLTEGLSFLKKMHASINNQQVLTEKDLELAYDEFQTDSVLYRQNVISKQEYRDENSKLLSKKMSLQQVNSSLLTNENAQIDKQKDIDELRHTISQQTMIFQQALQTMKSAVDDWDSKYIIRAPTAGKVAYIMPLQENQFIQAQKILGYVNPQQTHYYAQLILGQNNFGKAQVGQSVILRFRAYPYQEFGTVQGQLSYISNVPSSDSGFLAKVELPNGLLTNNRQKLQYKSGLRSDATILVKNVHILQRIFHNIF